MESFIERIKRLQKERNEIIENSETKKIDIKTCKTCGEILSNRWGRFCSNKCRDKDYYERNKQRYIDRSKEWAKNNPEKSRKSHEKAMKK